MTGLIPDEEARHALWLENRASRQLYRAQIEAGLVGNPVAYAQLMADTYPLVEFRDDLMAAPDDDIDVDCQVVNQDLNP